MKPQDRTRKILRSHLPTAQRMILVALADHMDKADKCFLAVETMERETGLHDRAIRAHLGDLLRAGILVRWDGGKRAPYYRIAWAVIEGVAPAVSKRGGRRTPAKIAGHDAAPPLQRLPKSPAKIATQGGKDCQKPRQSLHPKQAHEAPHEAGPGSFRTDAVQPDGLPPPGPPPTPTPTATTTTRPPTLLDLLEGNIVAEHRLVMAGITSPDMLCALRPSELRKRHGVGAGTVQLVGEKLAKRGLSMAHEPPTAKPEEDPRLRAVTDEFAAAWRTVKRIPKGERGYPWSLGKGGTDKRHRGPIADAFDLHTDDPDSRQRLRRAAEAYIEAALAGRAFPFGEPPTFAALARDAAKWRQVADGHAPTAANGRPALPDTSVEDAAIDARIIEREQRRRVRLGLPPSPPVPPEPFQ